MLALEAERPGHAAAARIEQVVIEAEPVEDARFIIHLHHRFVMAMAVNDGTARQARQLEISRLLFKKLAEQEGLMAQAPRVLVVREEVRKLVPEDGNATRLKPD